MPDKKSIDAYKDPYLTNFARGYRPPKFFHREFVKSVSVLTDAGRYQVKGNRLFLVDDSRAPRTKAKTIEAPLDSFETYACVEHALSHTLDKRKEIAYAERNSAGHVLDLRENAVKTIAYSMEVAREYQSAQNLFNPAKYATNNKLACTASDKWNTTTADIAAQAKTARTKMYESCGVEPNACIMGKNAYELAIANAKLIAKFYQTEISVELTDEQLKKALKVDKIYVVDVHYANKKGVLTKVWDANTVAFIYVPTPEELALGLPAHTVSFDLLNSIEVNEFDEGEVLRLVRYENYDIRHISGDNGYLISGVA